MRRPARLATLTTLVALATSLALPGGARASGGPASLPSVAEGPRPGPAALYAPPATTPILANAGRWDAAPIMVSGSAAYRSGEFLYQDYLYDDWGPNTTDRPFASPEPRIPASSLAFGGQTGDAVYPTDGARYGFNAADLVELRIDTDATSVAYRFTLNTMKATGATALAVGIRRGAPFTPATDWGHGLGALGVAIDAVLFTNGVTAEVNGTPVTTSSDLASNQIEVVVPRAVLDPGPAAVWRHYAVAGIAEGTGFAPLGDAATASRPGGAQGTAAPPVFNVAFRFEAEGDEPMYGSPATSAQQVGTRSVGAGSWRDHGQARALAARDISGFGADVDFGTMASGVPATNAPATGYMNRIYVSSLDLGEGVASARPWLLGKLQPYSVYVPTTYTASAPAGLILVLHSLSATYNQFAVFSPHAYRDLAEERGAIALTTQGRGPDSWYQREGELDVFEAWADVARTYALDPDRTAVNGYSMGGYGTYKLGAMYPDLFGKAFPVVGPPAEGIWPGVGSGTTLTHTILENFRNLPLMIWDGIVDELVPISGVTVQAQRLDDLGYRYLFDVFTGDHFALAIADEWDRAKAWMGDAAVDRDPAHVTYKVMPADDFAAYGLVHDKAYWVWDVKKAAGGATGLVDARSLAGGLGDPASAHAPGAGVDPLPYVERGRVWGAAPAIAAENAIELRLDNVAEVTLGSVRAGLSASAPMRIGVDLTGPATLRLHGAWASAPSVSVGGSGVPSTFDSSMGILTIPLAADATLVVSP